MKNILLTLMVFGIFGCALTPSQSQLSGMSNLEVCQKKYNHKGEQRYPYIKEELRRKIDCGNLRLTSNDLYNIHYDYEEVITSDEFKSWLRTESSANTVFVNATNPCCDYNKVNELVHQYKETSFYTLKKLEEESYSGTTLDSFVGLLSAIENQKATYGSGKKKYKLIRERQRGKFRDCYYEGGNYRQQTGKAVCERHIRK